LIPKFYPNAITPSIMSWEYKNEAEKKKGKEKVKKKKKKERESEGGLTRGWRSRKDMLSFARNERTANPKTCSTVHAMHCILQKKPCIRGNLNLLGK
jgi:hypothetical protein